VPTCARTAAAWCRSATRTSRPSFWLPDPSATTPRQFDEPTPIVLPRDATGTAAPASTGNGVGTRVAADAFSSPLSGAAPSFPAAPPRNTADNDSSGSFRVQNEIEPDPDEPPNNAPIAVVDAATLDEDSFVVIDVTSNDTDADGDALRVDGWDAEPDHGTLQLNEDGTLTYTPFRDFSGPESFTVNITDGRDTATATVTLTVSPVNDAPLAFHDGFTYRNEVVDGTPTWPTETPYPYVGVLTGSLLSNDYDVDGEPLSIGALDFTDTVGTVNVNTSSGTFSWEGPWDFVGETSFRYKVTDGAGGVSGWATARMWSYAPQYSSPGDGWPVEIPPSPAAVAADDLVPVGDTEGSDEVMGNDSNGYVAVVLTHSTSTRLTSFGFGGGFNYRPGTPRSDDEFSYCLFGSGGATWSIGRSVMSIVDLRIRNGQFAQKHVDDTLDDSTGAFTVANGNDTDGDGKVDHSDSAGVRAAHGGGIDEVDLMRLVVRKPAGLGANDKVTVEVKSGSARIYDNQYREGASTTKLELVAAQFTGDMGTSCTYWVEVYSPSSKIRDVAIEMSYRGRSDTVRATGVWAHILVENDIHTSGDTWGADADDTNYQKTLALYAGPPAKLGYPGMSTKQKVEDGKSYTTAMVSNPVEFVFTVNPPGIGLERVEFDISRSAGTKSWRHMPNGKIEELTASNFDLPTITTFDRSNDDRFNRDEDNTPKNDHIYSLDAPSVGVQVLNPVVDGNLSGGRARLTKRQNSAEFVRVKFDGSGFNHNPVRPAHNKGDIQGSRASELVVWHAWIDIRWDAPSKTWVRTDIPPAGTVAPNSVKNHVGFGFWDMSAPVT